jgi:hypothetical protein
MSSLVRERAKAVIPPSLMDSNWDGDCFESAVLSVMDFHCTFGRPVVAVAAWKNLLELGLLVSHTIVDFALQHLPSDPMQILPI